MGIPTAAVVNFDILRNEDLIGLLEQALVPKAIIEHVRTLALPIVEAFVRNGAAVKEHGIGALGRNGGRSCLGVSRSTRRSRYLRSSLGGGRVLA